MLGIVSCQDPVLSVSTGSWHETMLGRGASPLPTGYDWHGDALVSLDSDGFRPVGR